MPQSAVLRRLKTPQKIQDFLDYELDFNDTTTGVCLSPFEVLKCRRAHCIEGAMLAAAAFLFHGRPPLLLDLRADSTDDDHVIAPFLENGRWGAVAQSQFCGLRFREPIYGSVAELAKSYFEFYYNDYGRKTLREFSAPLNLARLKPEWLYGADVRFVSKRLDAVRHYRILSGRQPEKLRKADSLLYEAEILGCGRAPLTLRRARPYSRLAAPGKK
ncbi:MAG TPA: hypothetical protein DEF68_10960 [Elusimicrobia bacterium]|nr:hypothetical protein [Elusimicrobiota bacterium]HBW23882.1 hypothetical protein [Elusimicrobiota bacterium]